MKSERLLCTNEDNNSHFA